jgi:[ribosomal protein S5]-alanine N-acetyltransferase
VHYTALPALEHPQATLRALRTDDLERWFAILSQPLVYEHTSWNVSEPADLRHHVEGQDAPTPSSAVRFAVVRRDDGEFIGSAGFHTVSALNRTAEIAYDLAPEVWGQGIARAACHALTEWAFEHVGLVRVQATALHSNLRSQRVLEACGFQREGLLRRLRMVRGTPGDFILYARLA